MNRVSAGIGIGMLLVCGSSNAWGAAFSSTYLFDNPGDVPPPPSGSAVFSPFSRTGLQPATGSGTFATAGWSTGAIQDPTQFVQFTLTPSAGFFLGMTSMSFDAWNKNSAVGPTAGLAEIFLGAGPGMTSMDTLPFNITSSPTTLTFDFGDFSGVNSQPITVRFYAWNSRNKNNGELYFDNVTVNGDVSPVPEPLNLALGVFGLCMGGVLLHGKLRPLLCRRQRRCFVHKPI